VLGPPDLPEEGLSGGPEQDRLPEVAQRRQAGEQRPVVLGELGEAEPGVEHEPVGADPRGESGVATGGELAAYLRDDVGVCRAVLHVDAVPRQCMTTNGTCAAATRGNICGSASPR
jgi:hypothetical protein